jgi:hypothetical protein
LPIASIGNVSFQRLRSKFADGARSALTTGIAMPDKTTSEQNSEQRRKPRGSARITTEDLGANGSNHRVAPSPEVSAKRRTS